MSLLTVTDRTQRADEPCQGGHSGRVDSDVGREHRQHRPGNIPPRSQCHLPNRWRSGRSSSLTSTCSRASYSVAPLPQTIWHNAIADRFPGISIDGSCSGRTQGTNCKAAGSTSPAIRAGRNATDRTNRPTSLQNMGPIEYLNTASELSFDKCV